MQYFDFFETDEEFNNDQLEDKYTKEIVQQVIDASQPVLSDRCKPYVRLEEYFDRRFFLTNSREDREERMVKGIQDRSKELKEKLTLGDVDIIKGEEFINMVKDYYYDDEAVKLLIEKVERKDYK